MEEEKTMIIHTIINNQVFINVRFMNINDWHLSPTTRVPGSRCFMGPYSSQPNEVGAVTVSIFQTRKWRH